MGLFDGGKRKKRTATETDSKLDPDRMVAAAVAMRSGKETNEYRRSLPQWQRQSLDFYELLGEAWFPAQFYSRMLSRVRLYPAVRLPNGEADEVENEAAQKILSRIRDAGGSSQWKSQYGRLQFLIGDGYLMASLDEDGEEQWEYLSPAELIPGDKRHGRKLYARKVIGGNDIELTEAGELDDISETTVRVWRMWRKHPSNSQMADSPLRGVIGLLRVLMLLDKAQEAQAISRIAGSGLLVVDDRITIPVADSQADDTSIDDDPFMSLLAKYITAPIGDPGSASAMAPLVARVDVPEGMTAQEMIALIQLHDPNQTADWQLRIEKVITRIAIGLDMPPEEFLGLAGANHWTGWVITEEKWKAHGEPVTIQLCEDLTSAYFRAACIDAEVENAENLIVWYDAAQVVTHPDQGKSALEVHEHGELSGKSLRAANNFNESDAPSDEERKFFQEMKLKTSERPKDPSEADASETGADAPGDAPKNNGKRTNQPSPQPGNQDMKILAAAELALERIRERAGSMLRTKRMTCDGCFNGTENVPNSAIAAAVGPDVVATLGFLSEEALVAGGTAPFVSTLVRWGLSEARAQVLASRLERHAADTLYEPDVTLPDDLLGVDISAVE